ncbi:MAG: DUF3343 domain-containing protein [Desulfuromonas sp.]|nr:DUF3343 domain-containing protein [Desulfuromonas sp.]
MVQGHHLLVIFNSVHKVMLAENQLKKCFDILLIPVPRALSADCGMVLRFDRDDQQSVVELLTEQGLTPFTLYAPAAEGFSVVGEFS